MENADAFQTYHDIPEEMFTFKGALWRARLLPWSTQQASFVQETSLPGEKTKFAHISHIVVYFSHVITDGYSCMRIMKTILRLFNDVISETPIDDAKQVGTLLDVSREEKVSQEIRKAFEDPAFLEQRKQSYCSVMMETLFEKAFPVQPNLKPKTVCLVHKVDEVLTKKFVSRCKKEGCTVHTGFCALIETALIKLMQEAGVDKDSYKLSSLQAADNRVYYDNCHDEFGVGMGVMDFTHEVKKEELSDFWNQAKKYHQEFKKQHSYKPGLEHAIIEELTGVSPMVPLNKDGQSSPSKSMCYYVTTNMRDITGILGNCGDQIELEFIDRLTTMHLFPCMWMNTFNTFKGKFFHSLQYNSHVVSQEVAQKFSDMLFKLFEEVPEL